MELDNTQPEIMNFANSISENLLPQKLSRHNYEKCYALIKDEQHEKKRDSFSENLLIAFFGNLSSKLKSYEKYVYSIIKTMFNVKPDIGISRYQKLKAFLKRSSETFDFFALCSEEIED